MTQPYKQWTVLPRGKLVQVDENILTVVGEIHMPLMDLPRRMTVVRLVDARPVVFSAIALDDDEMSALEAYGRPAYLIVPSDKHRLDAKTWGRFPRSSSRRCSRIRRPCAHNFCSGPRSTR